MNKKEASKITNESVIKNVSELLSGELDREWHSIYKQYSEKMCDNIDYYIHNRREFHICKPLAVYCTMGMIMNGGEATSYDLRYAGESVGGVQVNSHKKILNLILEKNKATMAKKAIGLTADKRFVLPWLGKEASAFRKFYKSLGPYPEKNINSLECHVESFFLNQFSKGKLRFLTPVVIGKMYFQFKTPLKASDHKQTPTMSLNKYKNGTKGGGVDILARVTHRDIRVQESHRLAIIEIKNQNNESESQDNTMSQALSYATFFAHLLCPQSKSREKWFKILGFNYTNLPEKIDIDVVTLMPSGDSTESKLGDVTVKDCAATLHTYTLYYKVDANGDSCELEGTLLDALEK